MVLVFVIGAAVIVSLISFVGVLLLWLNAKALNRVLLFFISFAIGAMLGAVFLDLLPEAAETVGVKTAFTYALAGMIVFYVVEKFLHWHHHHEGRREGYREGHHEGYHVEGEKEYRHVHPVGYLNLVGDAIHNFIDGALIAASFLAGFPLGFISTAAIIAHEIPQELGDFSVLLYSGFEKSKALAFNFLSALTAVAGALVTFFAGFSAQANALLISFAAGSLLYIAATDLIPELHKHEEWEALKSIAQVVVLLFGIAVIWFVGNVFEH